MHRRAIYRLAEFRPRRIRVALARNSVPGGLPGFGVAVVHLRAGTSDHRRSGQPVGFDGALGDATRNAVSDPRESHPLTLVSQTGQPAPVVPDRRGPTRRSSLVV